MFTTSDHDKSDPFFHFAQSEALLDDKENAVGQVDIEEPCLMIPKKTWFNRILYPWKYTKSAADNFGSGTFECVFIPVFLSIYGITIFIRFGWAVGEAGFLLTVLCLFIGYSINIASSLSQSALSSNGSVSAAGIYYLVSRCLGPEFGASIGVLLWFGNVMSAGMNIAGLVETVLLYFGEDHGRIIGVLPISVWHFKAYSSVLLFASSLLSMVGSKIYQRTSCALFVLIVFSSLIAIVSFIFKPPFEDTEHHISYSSWSLETFRSNLCSNFKFSHENKEGKQVSFSQVVGVLYFAFAGVLSVGGFSNSLKDPPKKITKGTNYAILVTFLVYIFVLTCIAFTVTRSTLYENFEFMTDISFLPWSVLMGILSSGSWYSVGSIISATNILPKMGKDQLHPIFGLFNVEPDRKPFKSLMFTWFAVQLSILISGNDFNSIAIPTTMSFILSYLTLNLAVLALEMARTPNWRPTFKYFSAFTAGYGVLASLLMMLVIDWIWAIVSIGLLTLLWLSIHYSPYYTSGKSKDWGQVGQALVYHQLRKYLLRLDPRKQHVKSWRPQILLFVKDPRPQYQLILFINSLKKGALYLLGHIFIPEEVSSTIFNVNYIPKIIISQWRKIVAALRNLIDGTEIKAFSEVSICSAVGAHQINRNDQQQQHVNRNFLFSAAILESMKQMITLSGLGAMQANFVIFGLKSTTNKQQHKQQKLKQISKELSYIEDSKFTIDNIPTDEIIDNGDRNTLTNEDYCCAITFALEMDKSVGIASKIEKLTYNPFHDANFSNNYGHFSPLRLFKRIIKSSASCENCHNYIDLWPFLPDSFSDLSFNTTLNEVHQINEPLLFQRSLSSSVELLSSESYYYTNDAKTAGSDSTINNNNKSRFRFLTNSTTTTSAALNSSDKLFDIFTSIMILQMGWILHSAHWWKKSTKLRVNAFVLSPEEQVSVESLIKRFVMVDLRIRADIKIHVAEPLESYKIDDVVFDDNRMNNNESKFKHLNPSNQLKILKEMILKSFEPQETLVTFTGLAPLNLFPSSTEFVEAINEFCSDPMGPLMLIRGKGLCFAKNL